MGPRRAHRARGLAGNVSGCGLSPLRVSAPHGWRLRLGRSGLGAQIAPIRAFALDTRIVTLTRIWSLPAQVRRNIESDDPSEAPPTTISGLSAKSAPRYHSSLAYPRSSLNALSTRLASPVPLHRARSHPCPLGAHLRAAARGLGRQCHQDRCV